MEDKQKSIIDNITLTNTLLFLLELFLPFLPIRKRDRNGALYTSIDQLYLNQLHLASFRKAATPFSQT